MQNQQQLPFDPQNLMWQPQHINIDNPPFVPNVGSDPRANQWLPAICGLLMTEIQECAQPGRPMRVFMYNLYANNGWRNENFARTVSAIADWFVMAMDQNQYRSEQDCLLDIVPKMAELAAAAQLRDYPELGSYIDANTHNATVDLINRLDGIANQIQGYMSGNRGSQWGNRGGGNSGDSWMDRQRNWSNQRSTGGADRWEGSSNRQPARGPEAFASGGSNLFSGRQAGGDRWGRDGKSSDNDTRFDRAHRERAAARVVDLEETPVKATDEDFNAGWRNRSAKPAPAEKVEIEQTGSTAALNRGKYTEKVQEAVEVLADEAKASGLRWRPTIDQPHPLAFNPLTHLLYLRRETSHAPVIQVLKERKEGTVDYEKHKIVRNFGPSARKSTPEENQRRLENMRAALEPKNLDDPTLTEAARELLKNRVVDPKWIMETSQEMAWVMGIVGRQGIGTEGGMPDIYHRFAKICVPIVGDEDQSDLIKELATCDTYEALKLKLLGMGPKMNPELWQLIETKLTEAVNRILCQRLSIDDVRIGSFIEDVTDLLPVIAQQYGPNFVTAFNVSAKETIKAMFRTTSDELAENLRLLTDDILADYEGPGAAALKFTYLVSDVTMTYLTCLATELEIELDPKKASLVTVNTPFVRELVEDIMLRADDGFDCERHFIRTAEGRVLEVTRGLLDPDALLLRCVR